MKDKKIYLIIIIILVIYGFIFFIFVDKNNDKKKRDKNIKISKKTNINKKYLISGDSGNFAYYNNKIQKATVREIENSKKDFIIYSDNDYLGKVKSLQHASSWNAFDSNKNYISYEGNFFAYTSDLDISKVQGNFREVNDTEKDFINSKLNISDFDSLADNQVFETTLFDEECSIINITNIVDDVPNKTYNLIILKKADTYKLIELNNASQMKGLTSLVNVFKFKDNYYITVEKVTGFSNNREIKKTIIYRYDNKNIKKVIEN